MSSDSEAVTKLKALLTARMYPYQRKRIYSAIRSQRLSEARERGTHTADEWLNICREFDFRCVICGCIPIGNPCKDHIVPLYQGGSDAASNLQPVCRQCNTAKGPDTFNWANHRREVGFGDEQPE